ncbi:hypothetical protein BF49_3034 [Bradyrhizobium sp.]|nr:hypothetical protein BF49_3034 [Bradyrhizobium sp.]
MHRGLRNEGFCWGGGRTNRGGCEGVRHPIPPSSRGAAKPQAIPREAAAHRAPLGA